MEEQDRSLEELLGEIEVILERMQEKDIPLEESFVLYEQGIRKLNLSNEKIGQVEKKMQVLNEG